MNLKGGSWRSEDVKSEMKNLEELFIEPEHLMN